MVSSEELCKYLGLEPLPGEGGFYRETYRSELTLDKAVLGGGYSGKRPAATAIYYMLTPDTVSALHRLPGDEIYHFYLGDPVEMLQLKSDGTGKIVTIGTRIIEGMHPQIVVPGGVWQGSRLAPGGKFALLGTTMAPGFEFADYESGSRRTLVTKYPAFAELIKALTPAKSRSFDKIGI